MPEFPDFDAIALDLANLYSSTLIAEQLRLVWNARGAADLTALEPIIGKLGDTMDPDNARVFVEDALRMVDH